MSKIVLSVIFAAVFLIACNRSQPSTESASRTIDTPTAEAREVVFQVGGDTLKKVEKTPEEWRGELNEQEYEVLRLKGTERAYTGDLWDHKGKGMYVCRGCQLPLFSSETKFKSGTGWPSFWKPVKEEYIGREVDDKYGWNRTEVLCARCDGHLGHVFKDGPEPTGLRYCINSVSLNFVAKEQ